MCGGYTRVCVHCGLCGKVEPRPLNARGICPVCGNQNSPDAERCEKCGVRIPKPPGQEMLTVKKEPHCAVAHERKGESR